MLWVIATDCTYPACPVALIWLFPAARKLYLCTAVFGIATTARPETDCQNRDEIFGEKNFWVISGVTYAIEGGFEALAFEV